MQLDAESEKKHNRVQDSDDHRRLPTSERMIPSIPRTDGLLILGLWNRPYRTFDLQLPALWPKAYLTEI